MAGKRIFVSYSSPDADKANLVREAIEAAGISCWIAPRDLEAGNQWGGSIVQAIQSCEAVVVVFSEAANRSPQVAREMELSVSNRKQLIPIRVANDMPTDDMQYFLGVSHWFNAFARPLETYLPEIVASVKNILAKENNPWANAMRRMPRSRNGQILLVIGAVVLAAILLATFLKPPSPASLARMMDSPLTGRWEAQITDSAGRKNDCVFDLPKAGVMATFSDGCPQPLSALQAQVTAVKGSGVVAPEVYKSGDSGTFGIYGGQAGNVMGAYKFGLFGGLTTRDPRFGEVRWKKISNSRPLPRATEGVLPRSAQWPLSGVSGLIGRANKLMRSKWREDAVLMSIEAKPSQAGGVDVTLEYYSPSTRHVRAMQPGAASGEMGQPQADDRDTRQSIPDHVMDLSTAMNRVGLQPGVVQEADLEWTNGGCGTGNFAIDNAILPRCPPGNVEGVQWRMMVMNGSPRYVPAVQ